MKMKTLTLATAGLLLGGVLAYLATKPAGLPAGATVSGMPSVGGPFSLVDQTGKQVTDKDFHGKYMLVFFGFTHCPDICPSGLQVMTVALDKLGPKADEVTPVFISLDAERDTPDVLSQYVKSFSPRVVGLTGTAQEIESAAKAYRVYYKKVVDKDAPDNYTYDHSAIFYLMGKNGEFVAPIPHTTDPDAFAKSLEAAIK